MKMRLAGTGGGVDSQDACHVLVGAIERLERDEPVEHLYVEVMLVKGSIFSIALRPGKG